MSSKQCLAPLVESTDEKQNISADPQLRSAQNEKGKSELGKSHFECCEGGIKETTVQIDTQQSPKWPFPFDDDFSRGNTLPILSPSFREVKAQIESSGTILMRLVTWNQQARPLPTLNELRKHLIPFRIYHIIALGTQECEKSICKSILNPKKEKWEKVCAEVIGDEYKLMRSHALQGSHLSVYVHKAILHHVSNIKSHAVPTGLCDKLGNKGGIGISFSIGKSSICVLTAHLAAHQSRMDRRTVEFKKISHEMAIALGENLRKIDESGNYNQSKIGDNSLLSDLEVSNISKVGKYYSNVSDGYTDDNDYEKCNLCCGSVPSDDRSKNNPLTDVFDFVFWAGDLNFRIHGTREIVDTLLAKNQHDVLINNDQLTMLMQFDPSFFGLQEGMLTFRPTYKFNKGSDVYDTSSKRRIPSWTDRILYKANNLDQKLLCYFSANHINTSDHKPVYASFQCKMNIENKVNDCFGNEDKDVLWKPESKSEVCVIS